MDLNNANFMTLSSILYMTLEFQYFQTNQLLHTGIEANNLITIVLLLFRVSEFNGTNATILSTIKPWIRCFTSSHPMWVLQDPALTSAELVL